MRQQIHIRPSFHSLTRAPDLRKTTTDLKRVYLDAWNHIVDAWCTRTTGNHQKLFIVPYTNSCLYIILFFSLQRLPICAITHLNVCGQHMTIFRRFEPPLQWNLVALDIGIGHRYVVQPWYQFLTDSNFSHDDEASFYYRRREKIWEIVIHRKKDWDDDSDTD